MRLSKLYLGHFVCGVILIALCSTQNVYASSPDTSAPQTTKKDKKTISGAIRVEGNSLIDASGKQVLLQGVAFGNNVWLTPRSAPRFHHDERDYARVRAMGMNTVRFYLNYQLFEDDAEPFRYREEGFAWLDKNIAWAKTNGIVLLLNMHVPQGGFQSNGDGNGLWNKKKNRKRFIALWQEIAKRYRDEPTVAGLDLLNEPRPPKSIRQWRDLAEQTVKAIRKVNKNTMIVVERALSIGDDFSLSADASFFRVDDDNVLYQFHFYSPIEYTHQNASWTDFGDGGSYPDPDIINPAALRWKAWSWQPQPPTLPPGDSDWRFYESPKYAVADDIDFVLPVMVSELNSGTAFFDDLSVNEYRADGSFVRKVVSDSLDSTAGFQFWQAGKGGKFSLARNCRSGKCFAVSNTNHDANIQNPNLFFAPKAEHLYSISGYMKGVNVSQLSRPDPRGAWTQKTRAAFRLDYFQAQFPTGRTKEALAAELDRLMQWGKNENVPLYLGEFGLIYHCYRVDKGGLRWVSDMLDLVTARDLHFTFHAYHEIYFAIYRSDATRSLPRDEDAVPGLVELFKEKLRRGG